MKVKRKKKRPQFNPLKIIFALVLILGFFAVSNPNHILAQDACTDEILGKSRTRLEQELEACEREIAKWTATLNNIKGKNIAIANLTKDIATKQSEISVLDTRITKGKKAIADILRKTNDINSYSLAEAMLSDKNLSEFFVDIDTYASAEQALANLFAELRKVRALTESEKTALNKKREAEAAARAALETSKKEVEIANAEKKTLLAVSQSREKTYEQVLADRQAKAAQIKAVLFPTTCTPHLH